MSVWAIIPVKRLERSKTRLSAVLSEEERIELMRSLLINMLQALTTVSQVDHILVASLDKSVAEIAEAHGAQVYNKESKRKLNVAVAEAAQVAYNEGAAEIMVLPVDLPLFCADSAETLLAADGDILICADEKFDGTNALVLRNVPDFAFHFGEDSFSQHLKEATRHGKVAQTVFVDEIQFDLDTPADWRQYQTHLDVEVP